MTRAEAVRWIIDTADMAESEFCVTSDDIDAARAELREALAALGVTAEEIEES